MTKKPEKISPKKFKSNTYERLIKNIPKEILEWRKKNDMVFEEWCEEDGSADNTYNKCFALSNLFLPRSNWFNKKQRRENPYRGFCNIYYEDGDLKHQEIKNGLDEADQEIHLDKQGNLIKFKIYFYGYYGLYADRVRLGAIVIYFKNDIFIKREIVPSDAIADYFSIYEEDVDVDIVVKKLYENYVNGTEKSKKDYVTRIDVNFSEIYEKGTLKELSFLYVNEEFKQEVLFRQSAIN